MARHFLSLADIPASELRSILDEAHRRKKARAGFMKGRKDGDAPLENHVLAMLFEKNSTRTRFSFDMAMTQLGGSNITVTSSETQLTRGESIEDTAKVLSRFVDGIMVRANSHDTVSALAHNATIPVVNGLTDYNHPCQIMADLMTLEEHGRTLRGSKISWVGDGNNVAMSFINGASKFGYELTLSCPKGYTPKGQDVERVRAEGGTINLIEDPIEACDNADVVVTDCWVSMGDKNAEARMRDFAPYQVNDGLMEKANKDALFLHCLPAHRGEEVSASVIDGPASVVFDEAENRLHAQKAILKWCFEK